MGGVVKRAWHTSIDSFEQIGRSVEAVSGWSHVEQFLGDVADGFAFSILLFWALRWWLLVCFIAVVVVSR